MNLGYADTHTLILGLLAGILFGFFLRKGSLTRFETIVGQFILKDFTVVKVMLTAITIGSIGVYVMHQIGIIEKLPVKEAVLYADVLGGAILGIGMVILGYCPGTCVGAAGQGSSDAVVGILGMIVGAGLFAESYDWFHRYIIEPYNLGKVTFPTLTNSSPWWWIAGLTVITIILFVFLEKWERSKTVK